MDVSPSRGADATWAVFPFVDGDQVHDDKDRVRPIHPVYAIPQECKNAMRGYFVAKPGF